MNAMVFSPNYFPWFFYNTNVRDGGEKLEQELEIKCAELECSKISGTTWFQPLTSRLGVNKLRKMTCTKTVVWLGLPDDSFMRRSCFVNSHSFQSINPFFLPYRVFRKRVKRAIVAWPSMVAPKGGTVITHSLDICTWICHYLQNVADAERFMFKIRPQLLKSSTKMSRSMIS